MSKASAWFYWNQQLLLEMSRSYYGRELLCINTGLTDILQIRPNSVVAVRDGKLVTEIRTHAKYSKVIRHRGQEFLDFKGYTENQMYRKAALGNFAMGVPVPVGGGTVSTFFPNPHVEVTSVDGQTEELAQGSSFAALVGGSGTGASDSATTIDAGLILIDAADNTDEYTILRHGILLFDSSALPDGDNIDSAKLSIWGFAKSNGISGEDSDNSRIVAVSSAPATNTAVVSGDYDSLGSTSFGESDIQSSFSTGAYEDIPLNASGIANISKTGVSKFGIMYKWDFGNTATGLTWTSGEVTQFIRIRSADQTDTNQDPILEVTHSSGFQLENIERHYPRGNMRGVMRGAL